MAIDDVDQSCHRWPVFKIKHTEPE